MAKQNERQHLFILRKMMNSVALLVLLDCLVQLQAAGTSHGCCSQTLERCDVTWCGTTEAECDACADDLKWLTDGTFNDCLVDYACLQDGDCCDGLVCSNNVCAPRERLPEQDYFLRAARGSSPVAKTMANRRAISAATKVAVPGSSPTNFRRQLLADPIWDYDVDPLQDYQNNLGYPLQYPFERLFSVENIPQFVVITIDDGVSDTRVKPIDDYLLSIETPDARGCTPKATMFVSFDYTLCGLLRVLDKAKYEMATHTKSHAGFPSMVEIEGGFQGQEACGTPIDEVVGFRTPYLAYDQRVLNDLYTLQGEYKHTLYDSSVVSDAHVPTDYGRKNYWPWKWDHASKVVYNSSDPNGNAEPHIQSYNFDPEQASAMKGMWEVPMPLYYEPGTNTHYSNSMDYPFSHDIMWDNFNRRYNGNRAPFHINCHSPWLATNGASLKVWIEDLLGQNDDVFFITNKQLLKYMENPVSLSEYRQQRICDAPDYDDSYCFPPNYACSWWSQDWDVASCSCICREGFCLRDGICSDYNCPPGGSPVQSPIQSPVESPVTSPVGSPLDPPVTTPNSSQGPPVSAPVPSPAEPLFSMCS